MYSNPLLSFSLLLFIGSASADVLYPVREQLPLIARIGQPYSWTISSATFDSADNVSASSLPAWLSFSNFTFSGTPRAEDEGSISITLAAGDAQDSFSLCVTHFPPPTLRIPLAAQFNSSNPSMNSVFFLGANSALKDDRPAVRVPLHWSFSVGFEGGTFVNALDLFYYAQLANGSALPDWLSFDSKTVTLDGVARAPPLAEGERIELALIASDQAGYSAVRAPFDLIINSHDLASSGALILNVTAGEAFELDLSQNDWVFAGVTVDNTTIRAENFTSLSVDTSAATWISYDANSFTLSGTAPSKLSDPALSMTITAFNQSLMLDTTVYLLPSYFSEAALPGTFADPGSDFSFKLAPYLSTDATFSGHDISLSANTSTSFLNLTTGHDGAYALAGHVPPNPGASHIDIALTAYDHTTHAISHATLRVAFRTPNADAAARDTLARHRSLVLGLSIGLGGAAGLVALAGGLAIVRKCCHVPDSAVDPYNRDRKGGIGGYGLDVEQDGYGWSEKAGIGPHEVPAAYRAAYPGVGIEYTPSLVPGSPPAKKTTKAAFFSNVKAAVRNFSGGKTSSTRKSAISKPVLMYSKEGADSLRALRSAAGLDSAQMPESSALGIFSLPHQYENSGVESGSINAPGGEGISLGLGSGFGSSPTSSTGHSNETGKGSVPRQRADFGPPRVGGMLGIAPLPPIPRAHIPSGSKKTRTPQKPSQSHGHRRSTDTQATQSSTERDVELEEAVIITASRATSLRSARSSAGSYVPSTYTRDSVSAPPARPRLMQFTSARGVPAPVLTLNSLAGPTDPHGQRRVSQVAAVVSPTSAGADDADAIMTEGMRYVRAFGNHNADREPECPPLNLDRQSPVPGPAPSRSNSKRASREKGALSPATTSSSGSAIQTQSSYVYPSPSQSIESGVNGRKGDDNSSRGSRGSRGSLMMSRILVRPGEAFAFKYPVVLSSPNFSSSNSPSSHPLLAERKLIARPLYGDTRLPAFLAHTISKPVLSSSSSGKKRRARFEVEFWGTPTARDVGEVVVGIFAGGDGRGGEECVGRLVVEIVARG